MKLSKIRNLGEYKLKALGQVRSPAPGVSLSPGPSKPKLLDEVGRRSVRDTTAT